VDVLGHDYVSDDYEVVTPADLLEDFQEPVSVGWVFQKWKAVVTTEGYEVEVTFSVVTF
jgi:hypothetical protein